MGETGVGKTALVEGLAQRIVAGDVPYSLMHCRIAELDLGEEGCKEDGCGYLIGSRPLSGSTPLYSTHKPQPTPHRNLGPLAILGILKLLPTDIKDITFKPLTPSCPSYPSQYTNPYPLPAGSLTAGAMMPGEFEDRLKAVLQEVAASRGRVLLFIDDIHNLVPAMGQQVGEEERRGWGFMGREEVAK